MKKKIKMFFEYIKRLIKKSFAILSFITTISGVILFYTNFDTRDIIVNFIMNYFLYISFFLLFIGTYQVWNDMRLEKLVLEEKLKNPIDYEVKAYIKRVKFDLNNIESLIDKNIKEIESLIDSAERELENLSSNYKIKISGGISSTINVVESNYEIDLKNYIDYLKEYADKKDTYLLEWQEFNELELKDMYVVDFFITNIGRLFDEDIDIDINFNNENKYVGEIYLLDNIPNSLNLPVKPERKKFNDFTVIKSLDMSYDFHKFDKLHTDSNPLIYKRYEEIEERKFSIKLRDLKVNNRVRVFSGNDYFVKIIDKNDIDIIISSKNSTSKINKKLVYEDKGEFDYFQDKEINL